MRICRVSCLQTIWQTFPNPAHVKITCSNRKVPCFYCKLRTFRTYGFSSCHSRMWKPRRTILGQCIEDEMLISLNPNICDNRRAPEADVSLAKFHGFRDATWLARPVDCIVNWPTRDIHNKLFLPKTGSSLTYRYPCLCRNFSFQCFEVLEPR